MIGPGLLQTERPDAGSPTLQGRPIRRAEKNLKRCFTLREARVIMQAMAPILDDIRAAIKASGKTRYAIAKDVGISQSQLCQLMAGTKGLSVEAVERLAEYLGLEIEIRPKRRRKGR